MAVKKIKKGLYLSPWIEELIDWEADKLGGKKQGLAVSAAMLMFSAASNEDKAHCLAQVMEKEIAEAYRLGEGEKKKKKKRRQ